SRRRHTRSKRDWSSDVCSSDLTKIDGGATKNGDTAGSFGIGKNAPYCYSFYRTIFYRTLNKDGEYAAQGMARLLSFPTDLSDKRSEERRVGRDDRSRGWASQGE